MTDEKVETNEKVKTEKVTRRIVFLVTSKDVPVLQEIHSSSKQKGKIGEGPFIYDSIV